MQVKTPFSFHLKQSLLIMKTRVLIAFAATLALLSSCRKGMNTPATQAGSPASKAESLSSEDKDSTIIDFTMAAMDGTEMSVSKIAAQNKLTIIDFWASWCGPCRQEMPRLVQIYNSYKDKGLGVIGVSLDEERDAWESAVRSMNMQWPQLSDLQGWDNAAAVKYGIHSIPFTIVIDSECKALANGLRGDRLEQFVERQLGK